MICFFCFSLVATIQDWLDSTARSRWHQQGEWWYRQGMSFARRKPNVAGLRCAAMPIEASKKYFFYFHQVGAQGINGDSQEMVDFAAKTHELQNIIEKQVMRLRHIHFDRLQKLRFFFFHSCRPLSCRNGSDACPTWTTRSAN